MVPGARLGLCPPAQTRTGERIKYRGPVMWFAAQMTALLPNIAVLSRTEE